MRVIWISIGLLAIFLVTLGVLYEPAPDQQVAVDNKSAPLNPFVEETSTRSDPVATDAVDLAVLPADATGGDSSKDVAESANREPGLAAVTQAIPESQTSVTAPKAEQPENRNLEASDINSIVVTQPAKVQEEEKKPGLAMLAFEAEKNRNKVAVIVHESNPQKLTEKEIKALYLDRLTRWQDGSRVMLFNLPLGDKFRDKFSKSVLKMSALEADLQESKRRELRIKANDVEVKAKNVVVSYVEQHPNAVAYVPLNLVRDKSNVKVVLTIP